MCILKPGRQKYVYTLLVFVYELINNATIGTLPDIIMFWIGTHLCGIRPVHLSPVEYIDGFVESNAEVASAHDGVTIPEDNAVPGRIVSSEHLALGLSVRSIRNLVVVDSRLLREGHGCRAHVVRVDGSVLHHESFHHRADVGVEASLADALRALKNKDEVDLIARSE